MSNTLINSSLCTELLSTIQNSSIKVLRWHNQTPIPSLDQNPEKLIVTCWGENNDLLLDKNNILPIEGLISSCLK